MKQPDFCREFHLKDGDTVRIGPLPTDAAADTSFLLVQRAAYLAAYTGLPCIDRHGQADRIQPGDMDGIFDPDDAAIAGLRALAARGFDPAAEGSTMLLQASTCCEKTGEDAIIGTLNLKYGAAAYRNEPAPASGAAKVLLHEINVRPDMQGRGVGSLLLGQALAVVRPFCDSADALRLITQSGNNAAKAWYERLGIPATGRTYTAIWGSRNVRVPLQEHAAPLDAIRI